MPFPANEDLISSAESHLGRRLPEELRCRLVRDNGGEIYVGEEEWDLHPVWDPRDRRRMGRTASHIVRETETARTWAAFPPDAISVAINGLGDRLILRHSSNTIEYWDHETGNTFPVDLDWEAVDELPEELEEDEATDGSAEDFFLQEADLHRMQHEQEIKYTLNLPNWRRYNYFIEEVARQGQFWTLRSQARLTQARDAAGTRYLLVWPSEYYAALWGADRGIDAIVRPVEVTRWLEGQGGEELENWERLEVFPTPAAPGVRIEAGQAREHMRHALLRAD